MNINNSGSDGDGDQEDDFEVEISPPSYELMGKAPVIEDNLEPALREISAVLQSKSDMYRKRLFEAVERLEETYKILVADAASREGLTTLRKLAHNLKGEGGTFDYPMISEICRTFCTFIEDMEKASAFDLAVIRLHIDSIHMVTAQNLRGDVAKQGSKILEGLRAVIQQGARK
ncbi:MAG: hypothetical protein HOH26_08480 [Alphaproteobacteria bacterium]|nr:hypothetical protein [Alphaproteobacteria bacterium]